MGRLSTERFTSGRKCSAHVVPPVGVICVMWLLGVAAMSSAEQIDSNDIRDILSGVESLSGMDVHPSLQWGIADVSTSVGKLFHLVLPTSGGSQLKVSSLRELSSWNFFYKYWSVAPKVPLRIVNSVNCLTKRKQRWS